MPDDVRTLTYRYERWRALFTGILETAAGTFILLVAVRHFDAGSTTKAILATGGSAGLLLTPAVVAWAGHRGWTSTRAAALLTLIMTAALVVAAIPFLSTFTVGCLIAMIAGAAAVPFVTQMYQDNYPAEERGKLFSRTIVIRIAAACVFSELGGRILSGHFDRFPGLFAFFAFCAALSWHCLRRCPSKPLSAEGGQHPFRSLRFVREDRLFRWMLASWMFMGLGNLMMIPLRVEYLANPVHGVNLSTEKIALLVGVLPNVSRLVFSLIWGKLFDRMDFFLLRMLLNLGFAVGIVSFFAVDSMTAFVIGALTFGIALAGGDVAWSLWVTKLARPERVADYMAVHTFFTGLRGLAAPFLAFWMIGFLSVQTISIISVALILVATVMLIPEYKAKAFPKSGA
jgi:MFS family permease